MANRRPELHWYSVSVDTVRRLLALGALLLVVGVSYLGYLRWQQVTLDERASLGLQHARRLVRQVEQREDYMELRRQQEGAWSLLDEANTAYGAGELQRALSKGQRCAAILETLLEVGEADAESPIRMISLHGGVEFRQGDRGTWKRARSQISLHPGDWVKTSADGKAEILFVDGSVYTLRQNTMVHLGDQPSSVRGRGEERITDVVIGAVELRTTKAAGALNTPRAQARIDSRSQALVSFDEDRDVARFAAYRGKLRVISENGQERELSALQQVEQRGVLLSDLRPLPAAPELIAPSGDQEYDLDQDEELNLAWRPVTSAASYALRVSSSPLFASNIIDDRGRRRTSATVGIRGEGSFFWQVAAIARGGAFGPWSETRAFRVAAHGGGDREQDRTPPKLEIFEARPYGAKLLISGRTEPGARLEINGNNVAVQADGSFSLTIQATREDLDSVEIVATDTWGNETRKLQEVFTEAF